MVMFANLSSCEKLWFRCAIGFGGKHCAATWHHWFQVFIKACQQDQNFIGEIGIPTSSCCSSEKNVICFWPTVSSPFDKIWPPKNWHFLPPRSHFWGYWLALIGLLGLKWSPSIADQSLFQVDAHKHKDWPTKKMKDILFQDRAKLPKIRYARNAKLARVQTC